jgi:hypothetical protein
MRSASVGILTAAIAALVSLGATGCTLYFGGGGDDYSGDDVYYPPDARPYYPDAGPIYDGGGGASMTFARCEDGKIRHVSFSQLPTYTMPGHGAGTVVAATCANGCRSAIAQCASTTNCTQADQAVCNAPIATGPVSTFQGQTCSGSSTVTYTNTNQCGQVYPGGTCTCDASGKYACTAASDTAGVHADLVGKWHGTVTPPSFATPYQISLWIYADGTYWAECTSSNCYAPLYYGGNGPHPWRKINVLSIGNQIGATANIGMFYSSNLGAMTSIFVTDTTLRFTLYAAWFGCSQPFDFNLTRD